MKGTKQGKLVKYFNRQLSCKRKVSLQERSAELEGFPHLMDWFRIVNIRKEVTELASHPFSRSNYPRFLSLLPVGRMPL
eukprot:gi/632968482/ref/XP_007900550.1/ PREDICTED: kinase suppressor of Ras 2-like [Callorhinchus milii]